MKMLKKMMTWSLGTVLAITLAVAGVTPATASDNTTNYGCNAAADSSTPGTDGFTAPAITKLDASGSDQDGFCVPVYMFEHPLYGDGGYYVEGTRASLEAGFHKLKDGVSSITIVTSANSASGTWTLNFTDEVLGSEAPNIFRIELGDTCRMGSYQTRYREAVVYATNGDDKGDSTFNVWPEVKDVRGVVSVVDTEVAYDIADGDTAAMRIMEYESTIPGLRPGKYRVKFWQSRNGQPWNGRVVKRVRLVVPKCGRSTSVEPDSKQGRGHLKRLGCKAVKVTADARGFTAAPKATYRVVKKPLGGKTRQGPFVVAAGQQRIFKVKKPGRAKATVTLKVRRTNGTWVRLDRVRLPRCR